MSLRIRSTIITCSAASLAEPRSRSSAAAVGVRIPGARDRPLDRGGHDLVAAPTQEQLRRQRGDRAVRRVEHRRVRWRDPLERRGRQRRGAAVPDRVQPQTQVGLEDLPGRDPLPARSDRVDMPRRRPRVDHEWLGRGGPHRGRGSRQPAAQRAQPLLEMHRAGRQSRAPRTTIVRLDQGAARCRSRRDAAPASAPAAPTSAAPARPLRPAGSRASRTSLRRPRCSAQPRRRRPGAAGRARRTDRRRPDPRGCTTSSGSDPTIAPPPAHAPVSANGNRSPAIARTASAAVQEHGSGSRISVACSDTVPTTLPPAPRASDAATRRRGRH